MKTNRVMKINNMRTLRNKKILILILKAQQPKDIIPSRLTHQIRLLSTKSSRFPNKIPKNNKFQSTSNRIRSNLVLTHMAPNQWRASIPKNNIIRKAQSMDPMISLLCKRWTKPSTLLKRRQTNMINSLAPKRTLISWFLCSQLPNRILIRVLQMVKNLIKFSFNLNTWDTH